MKHNKLLKKIVDMCACVYFLYNKFQLVYYFLSNAISQTLNRPNISGPLYNTICQPEVFIHKFVAIYFFFFLQLT